MNFPKNSKRYKEWTLKFVNALNSLGILGRFIVPMRDQFQDVEAFPN